ncbi:hypothetical protein BJY52DRAFT_1272861 [Lactarius psammicola]|nr:hypothetical protein BJY52DRAFT_1272861 [Lactarius psammicola]
MAWVWVVGYFVLWLAPSVFNGRNPPSWCHSCVVLVLVFWVVRSVARPNSESSSKTKEDHSEIKASCQTYHPQTSIATQQKCW